MKENESIARHLAQATMGIKLATAHMYKVLEMMNDGINNPEAHICNLDITIADRVNWSLECDADVLSALAVEYEARN